MRPFSSVALLFACVPAMLTVGCTNKDTVLDSGTIATVPQTDDDGDGISVEEGDCDDADPSAYPGAVEDCDGVDNNCDGVVDEGVMSTWYQDGDGDGFGDAATTQDACTAPDGYVGAADDCDDSVAEINPDATEVCDDLDNDCDGTVDQDAADMTTWYADGDGDAYGLEDKTTVSCTQPDGFAALFGDCDDGNELYNPGADESDCTDPNDYNCDGSVGYADADLDGYAACEDCDDSASNVNPGHAEVCDNIDNDCDLMIDDLDPDLDTSTGSTFYADTDHDGFGDDAAASQACEQPVGYVTDNTDCDDTVIAVNPDATEICDGIDNDCDTLIDDADSSVDLSTGTTWYADSDSDGFGDVDTVAVSCDMAAGYVDNGDDCDDTVAAVNPTATEVCDEIDNDCDGLVDDADTTVMGTSTWYIDYDTDGYGSSSFTADACNQPAGYVDNSGDCDDADIAISPDATEVCDSGVDNDCNGVADDADAGVTGTLPWYADADSDGYGNLADLKYSCLAAAGYVDNGDDCDDTAAAVNPAATEVCDGGVDNDCNGLADDADAGVTGTSTWYADSDSDSYGDLAVSTDTCDAPAGYVSDASDCDDTDSAQYPGADEYCNGEDDDCDTVVDEDAVDGADLADDADADTFGDPGSTTWQCSGVTNELDCDDADATEPKVASATAGSASGDGSASAPYAAIQDAIVSSLACVVVEAGTYNEAVDFVGHDISVTGAGSDTTFIDASGTGSPGVTLATAETTAASLSGFSIIGGDGFYESSSSSYACTSVTTCTNTYDVYSGGGVYINGADPALSDLVISGITLPSASTVTSGTNTTYTYSYGGGVAVINGAPILTGVEFNTNFADQGGGLYVDELSDVTVSQSWFIDNAAVDGAAVQADLGVVSLTNVVSMWNTASADGGGLLVADGSATVTNSTWAGEAGSAAVYSAGTGAATMVNSIVYGATGFGILVDGSASFVGTYNDVYGSTSGNYSGVTDATGTDGNISSDPTFTAWTDDGDVTNDDPSLAAGSPAIDAGNPAASYDDADGTLNDMGAFGGPGSVF